MLINSCAKLCHYVPLLSTSVTDRQLRKNKLSVSRQTRLLTEYLQKNLDRESSFFFLDLSRTCGQIRTFAR